MEKHKTQIALFQLFNQFKYHEDIIDELDDLVVKTRKTKKFISLFEKNIKMIETLGLKVTKTKNFEKLQGVKDLYSMKFISDDMNLRILYSYDKTSSTIMLHCFYEKSDSGKDSYSSHIPVALERKKELEGKI